MIVTNDIKWQGIERYLYIEDEEKKKNEAGRSSELVEVAVTSSIKW